MNLYLFELVTGVMHTDDLSSYFNITSLFYNYETNDREFQAVSLLTQLVANFATSGLEFISIYMYLAIMDKHCVNFL